MVAAIRVPARRAGAPLMFSAALATILILHGLLPAPQRVYRGYREGCDDRADTKDHWLQPQPFWSSAH
jgi:hypothetical protein